MFIFATDSMTTTDVSVEVNNNITSDEGFCLSRDAYGDYTVCLVNQRTYEDLLSGYIAYNDDGYALSWDEEDEDEDVSEDDISEYDIYSNMPCDNTGYCNSSACTNRINCLH